MAPAPSKAPVLISGAGPTGLLFSLWLSKYGVPHRIVDKASGPGTASRAIVMHARTLELYRSLGVSDAVISLGTQIEVACVVQDGIDRGGPAMGKAGKGLSPFPFVLSVTQDEHEEQLENHLLHLGTHVERDTEVIGVDAPGEGEDRDAIVTLKHTLSGKEERVTASYVVGCDGAHSGVRHAVGIEMDGATYPGSFFVADVYYSGALPMQGRLNFCLSSSNDFMIHLPLPHRQGRARIIGFVPKELEDEEDLTFDHVRPWVSKTIPTMSINEVRWFARYKVHHRCAKHFQYGKRVFLCGDSAHLHSPVGGQGMNTGLGDASNLGWKLATAWHNSEVGGSSQADINALLATYEAERIPFARLLVKTTDRLFNSIIDQTWRGYLLRKILFPYILPFLSKFFNFGRIAFKRVSQTSIAYPESPLSEEIGKKSGFAGSRLPWVEQAGVPATEGGVDRPAMKVSGVDDAVKAARDSQMSVSEAEAEDNHAPLDAEGWQAHLFTDHAKAGDIPNANERLWRTKVESALNEGNVPLKIFPWTKEASAVKFTKDTIYLIRPDGHIGLVLSKENDAEKKVQEYVRKWGLAILPERKD